jgi:SWI/SNF-related matrix-associated actin-dependent regulator of chromatin subfamily A-like protein 1
MRRAAQRGGVALRPATEVLVIHSHAYRALFVPTPLLASLDNGEAVLRFPYDDRLRLLLRAIPGRRWDPQERTWRIPLDPEGAAALAHLLEGLPRRPQISPDLARAIVRRRARRRAGECVLDLARPDESWWLSFATDAAPEVVGALLAHPDRRLVPLIGRALIPLDERSERIVAALRSDELLRLRITEDAVHALTEVAQRGRELRNLGEGPGAPWRDGALAADARSGMARDAALPARSAPRTGSPPPAGADEEVPPRRAEPAPWHGTIEVAGEPSAPVFLLLGPVERLPPALRERASNAPGGVSVPLTLESWEPIEAELRGWTSVAARRCVAALRDGRPAPAGVLEISRAHEDPAFVLLPGHEPGLCERFAALPGALAPARRGGAYEHARLASIHADPFCVPELDRFLAANAVWIEPEALALLQEIRERHARGAGLVALSAATEGELEVAGLGGELKPFQRAGVRYLLDRRRAFLADEQGLGKTIEALAALQADDAFPAVVACPASLKLNWLREIERWLPGRSARALVGTGAGEIAGGLDGVVGLDGDASGGSGSEGLAGGAGAGPPADITVVNYDIVAARLEQLCAMRPRALVLDESHYCKSATAKRTQAAQRLAGAVAEDGLVLALTGTPVLNRPAELISQLRIVGRLGDFGSGAQFGRRFQGPDAHMRLHWHLRSRCYVRRLKADVLPQLPPKTRSVVPIELDNEAEYRFAERDVIAWLRSQPLDLRRLDARVAAALRAERLVRLNALKLLAARGKLRAALAWIHDFCSSGEPLVVFAKHREVQRAVMERFPRALHILGEDSHAARDAALRAFQEPDAVLAGGDAGVDGPAGVSGTGGASGPGGATRAATPTDQLIVCSLDVAGQGLTLTRASNVAFLELDWTPAKHDQAEDRCHRIGQEDAVNASYLLAAGTIDETIATLLERKRAVIGAVTDGRPQDEEGVVDALVRELAGAPYRALRAVA